MSASVPVINRAQLSAEAMAEFESELGQHTSLKRVLGWLFACSPPLRPEDLIAQDEYSHDLLVVHPAGVYLSYDTS